MFGIRSISVVALCALSAAACKLQTGLNTGGGSSGVSTSTPSSSSSGGGGGGGGDNSGGINCPNPQNHCLEADDVMIGDREHKSGYVTVNVAKQQGQPNATGEAQFLRLSDGSTQTTKYVWKTHPMTDAEVKVGAFAVMLDWTDNGLYRGPRDRQQATSTNWFLARIVSVDDLPHGHVLVSGGYKVARAALRAVDGDTSERLTTTGADDQWYVKPDYWFVSDRELPASGYITVHLALPIKAPSAATGNEGQFLKLGTGEIVWTKHAWKQRVANKDELKLGSYAISLDYSENNSYRPPKTREQAFTTNWFLGKIVDVGQAYKGVVSIAGYTTQIEGLRVIAK